MRRLLALVIGAWLCATPRNAAAQSIRGTVVDLRDRPLGGVVVLLVDSTAREVARSLTNDRGEYFLSAPRPGSYRLRTLRIGFRSVTTPVLTLGAGQPATRRIAVSNMPFMLDTVRATGRNACRVVARDSTSMVAALWDQIRSALIATQLSQNTRSLYLTILSYDRTLDPRSQRIGGQVMDIRSEFARQPWRSLGPDSLHRGGYVYNEVGGMRAYNAPDLEVLLSLQFLEDHCLRIAPGSTAQRLGIEFQPTPDRGKTTEIRGTLWLDRATNELRELEYGYVNVPRDEERAAGGQVAFTRMRNGMWAISRWSIRMPMFALYPVYGSMRVERRVDSVKVTGGELVLAVLSTARARDTLWIRPRVALNGVVLDSLSGRPVPNAVVALAGTIQMDTTDVEGRFAIHGVLPGRYAVNVSTPSLDSAGTIDQRTVLFGDSSVSIAVRVATASMIASTICGDSRRADPPAGIGIVVGEVTQAGSATPVANARVSAQWDEIILGGNMVSTRKHVADTRTDMNGAFRICGLPVNTALHFSATANGVESGPLPLRIPEDKQFMRAELTITGQAVATTSTFFGTVVDSAQVPLADVDVQLSDIGVSTRTNARGAFRIQGVLSGSHKVVVRRVGYGVLESEIEFTAGGSVDRRIVLTRLTVLDSVLAMADRTPDPAMERFEERRKMGLGRFVTREEILKREGAIMSSFLLQMPRLNLLALNGAEYVEGARGTPSRCNGGLPVPRKAARDGTLGKCLMAEGVYYVPDELEGRMGMRVACYARIFLDNQIMNPGAPSPGVNLRELPPTNQIEAIEWYGGTTQVPAEYLARNASCGVLVIHTRRYRPKEPDLKKPPASR